MKNNLQKIVFESEVTKDLNHKNFFDNENSKKTNDEGRVSSYDDGTELSLEFQEDDNSGVTSFNSKSAYLPINIVKRSSRHTKLPTSLNDLIIDDKVKYGVERVVNYANLNSDNFCFASSLNKSVEPTCYKNVILDKNKWPLFQLDVNNGFLYGDLEDDVYITIPQGFFDNNNKNKVCKLVKSLYGLKQALGKWNEKLVSVLKGIGFLQSAINHSLFTKSKINKFIDLLIYVDDIVITANCVNEIDQFKAFLKSKFNIKDLGNLNDFFGIEVLKTGNDMSFSKEILS
ncbi:ribonuclease H-like domain-containing protein [Tanacetum coccineum]